MGDGERYEELYLLKGIALLAMIVYHAVLVYGYVVSGDFDPLPIWYPLPIAGSFLFLSGISIAIINQKQKRDNIYKRVITRLAISAILVSLASLLALPDYTIWFGILHLLLFCYVVFWIVFKEWNANRAILLLVILITAGLIQYLFWPFGNTLDYTPIIPYAGIVFAGVFVGKLTYAKGKRAYLPRSKLLEYIGKHSLLIYLAHVPIIYLVFWVLFG